jgi:hypothetical protein
MNLPPTGLTSDIILIGTDGFYKLMISVKMNLRAILRSNKNLE